MLHPSDFACPNATGIVLSSNDPFLDIDNHELWDVCRAYGFACAICVARTLRSIRHCAKNRLCPVKTFSFASQRRHQRQRG